MCCPNPVSPGCSFPTRPCNSLFGITNRWWLNLACFLGTNGGYPAGSCHQPWYLLIGTTDWYPAAVVDPLPRHCLGRDTFINGSLHASFSAMLPSLVPGSWTLPGSIYLARSASGGSGLLKCLQLLYSTPQNMCARKSTLSDIPLRYQVIISIKYAQQK